MRKLIPLLALIFCFVAVGGVCAQESNKLNLKVGDELYVCGCGPKCDCDTMSMKPGKCVCGKPMVKGKVVKLEDGKALIDTGKEQKLFKTTGKYACACGKGCDCNTISQKPGKCVCGKAMKRVKAAK